VCERVCGDQHLRYGHEIGLGLRQVACEAGMENRRIDVEVSVSGGLDAGSGRWQRFLDRGAALASVECVFSRSEGYSPGPWRRLHRL
jgi:hypothetical protein